MSATAAQLALAVLTTAAGEPTPIKVVKYYSTKDVATILGCSTSHVAELARVGRLEKVVYAGEVGMKAPRLRFTAEAVQKFIG